jgi:Secretion system C-terminal sorting domain
MKNRLSLVIILLLFLSNLIAQNKNISNGAIFEGEPFMAVNPTNPNNMVVAWMGFVYNNGTGLTIKVKSTFNGGLTWSTAKNMPHAKANYKSADPSMVFDMQGNLFLSFIDWHETPDSGGVYVFKSTNGGLTWGNSTKVIDVHADANKLPLDRPWLSMNKTGDQLFITTKPAPTVLPPNRPYFMASIDSGLTWKPWRYLDTTGYLVGNTIVQPMAAPTAYSNKFYAVYPSYLASQYVYAQYILATSANAGNSFTYHRVIGGVGTATNDSAKLGYKLIEDPSDTNHLAFIFPYAPYGDIDVMITESFNGGLTWSTQKRVNDDTQGNGKMQDLVNADFDTDGDMIVTWRDRRNGSGSGFATSYEVYAAFLKKGTSNFSSNFKISDNIIAYDTILSKNGNDFMSVILRDDTLSAVWGDTRDGSLDIWFSKKSAINTTTSPTSISLINSENVFFTVYPNPTSGVFNVKMNDASIMDDIKIVNMKGDIVYATKVNNNSASIDLTDQASGVYMLIVNSNNKMYSQKIIR